MSAGHKIQQHEETESEYKEHSAFLEELLSNDKFVKAVQGYKNESDSFDVPFVGGSNNAGDTVYFDRRFVEEIKAGKLKYDGRPFDPRPFIRLHEAIEGAAIRTLGAEYDKTNKAGLPGGHCIASWAERRAVDHAGLDWNKYSKALEPFIKEDDAEKVTNAPPDLLETPYQGKGSEREDAEIKPFERAAAYGGYVKGNNMATLSSSRRNSLSKSTFGMPGERKYPMPDRSHAANAKARATQQVKAGNLSSSSAAQIRAKANRILSKSAGGYTSNGGYKPNTAYVKSKGAHSHIQGGYVANPAGNNDSSMVSQDKEMHPRQHALAMASATHLLNMGHIDQDHHEAIHKHATSMLKKAKAKKPMQPMGPVAPMQDGGQQQQPAFGSFAPQQ